MAQKISPNRRRSIAVLSQGQTSRHSSRRRAYSIVPGEKLSPAAKARRSLVPRKSILKTTINLPDGAGSTETSAVGDDTTTQSMDFTEVQSAHSRKSLARRVSFASHAHVRLFETQEQNTNSSAGPNSSPMQDSPAVAGDDVNDENAQSDAIHARRRSSIRRRSSVAFSEYGEQSMDMDMDDTAPLPNDFLTRGGYQLGGSAVEDDVFADEDDDDDDDMEITEAIRLNIERKRSLSLGQERVSLPARRSSIAPLTSSQGQSENQPPHYRPTPIFAQQQSRDHDQDQDLTTSSTQSQSYASEGASDDATQPMEFTIPISRSLRPPEPPSEAWLQLRAMTHAGDEPYDTRADGSDDDEMSIPTTYNDKAEEGEPMELTDAVDRLMKARTSLGLPPLSASAPDSTQTQSDVGDADVLQAQGQEFQDDSFTSTEDSFADDAGAGDRTVNVTTLMRASLGTQDSSIDATSVYSNTAEDERVVKVPITAGPPAPDAPPPVPAVLNEAVPSPAASSTGTQISHPPVFSAVPPAQPSVFSAPGSKIPAPILRSPSKPPPAVTVPKPFTFSLSKPLAPSSVAVSSPVGGTSHVQPQSPAVSTPTPRGTAAFALPSVRKSPLKRPAPADADSAHPPSPAKRVAVGKLEPSKKAPFEKAEVPRGLRRTSMVRRPSGYFSQRKSLGTGVLPGFSNMAAQGRPGSPKKLMGKGPGLGRARASVGSAPSGQGLDIESQRPDPTEGIPLYPDVARIIQEDPPTPSRTSSPKPDSANHCEREEFRQAIAVPSSTRGSPSPHSPRPASPVIIKPNVPQRPASPSLASTRAASSVTAAPSSKIDLAQTGIAVPRAADREAPGEQALDDVAQDVQPSSAALSTTQQWRDEVRDEDVAYDDEGPPISIEQFFAMTGIRFMDELTMPKPRQSVVPPPQLRSRSRRRSSTEFSTDADEDPIPLAEFSIAMAVELPRLELFTAVANDLGAWIEDSKKICLQAEKETEKVTPELFRDFVAADETEKGLLLHQLKLIKANNYGTAKSQWYDWKMDWTERLYGRAQQEFANLESDAQMLAKIIKQAQEMLPDLREEYTQVMAELEQEQADIAEVENSDQEYLNELKATIAEQSSELEAFRTDVSEGRAKLERLEEKLAEIESQKQETSTAIAQVQHIMHIQKESTSVEVFRLKDELDALQDLHLWRATKIGPDLINFIYASRYQVSIPCIKHKPIVTKVTVSRASEARTRERDAFPRFTELALRAAQQFINEGDEGANIRQIVERLGDFWSACSQLRSQFTFLAVKYPVSMEAVSRTGTSSPNLVAKTTYSRWPMSIGSLNADVEVAYGRIQQDTILDAVRSRLAQASSTDSHGCLLDACIEATEQYE